MRFQKLIQSFYISSIRSTDFELAVWVRFVDAKAGKHTRIASLLSSCTARDLVTMKEGSQNTIFSSASARKAADQMDDP